MTHGFDPELADPARAGVFYVSLDQLDLMSRHAHAAHLEVRRVDLSGIGDRATLLLRIAVSVDAPVAASRSWDALSEALRDLHWLRASGYVLLFDGAGEMHDTDEQDFDALIGILDHAQAGWRARGVPFWAFLALRDADFEAMKRAPAM
jgi:hypothetical protein